MSDTRKTWKVDLGARSYDIHIGAGLLAQAPGLLPMDLAGRRVFILADRNVKAHQEILCGALEGTAAQVDTLLIEGGEPAKSYEGLQHVLDWLLEGGVERSSVLFALGGGVIGDLGGFAASAVLRGIPFVQVPTTLLAQVDSSVGGKTGINTRQGKNLVGSFYQPRAVICDMQTLKTLPERELKTGYAEVVKYGLINKPDFFDWLEEKGKDVLALEEGPLSRAIETSCAAKAEIVAQDEREAGTRALLNFGHTFGHALEAAAGYDGRLLHGEAVGIGMVLAFDLSARMGLCAQEDKTRLETHLKGCGLKTRLSDISPALTQSAEEIAGLMSHDKKVEGGVVTFILARGIGQAFTCREVKMEDVVAVLRESM
ncbi:MAG: 3-dehydroquinate synthase [Rhodospirillales bacterium]|nr:3-dehydroquinate synthase [Alphaproteobacteria bacterium]USO03139.1 MAG: 3-dehydroquinate synthase [Rhodospirillales bacterium]